MTVETLPREPRACETPRPVTGRPHPPTGNRDGAAEREPNCVVSPAGQSWPRVFPGL
jgi:hypothetical protein